MMYGFLEEWRTGSLTLDNVDLANAISSSLALLSTDVDEWLTHPDGISLQPIDSLTWWEWGRSLVWSVRCLVKESLRLNDLQQVEHLCGVCSECTLIWLKRVLLYLNAFLHTEYEQGLSSVWTLLCAVKLFFCLNPFPQIGHWCGASSECTSMWLARVLLCLNNLPHTKHE